MVANFDWIIIKVNDQAWQSAHLSLKMSIFSTLLAFSYLDEKMLVSYYYKTKTCSVIAKVSNVILLGLIDQRKTWVMIYYFEENRI